MKLGDVAKLVSGELKGDAEAEITGVSGVESAGAGEITYASGGRGAALARLSRASCILVDHFIEDVSCAQIKVNNPQYAFARLLGNFAGPTPGPEGLDPGSYVSESASLAEDVAVGAFAFIADDAEIGKGSVIYPGVFIGRGSKLGQDCIIYPNAVIREGVTLGHRVIVHPCAVIGADGFGYVPNEGELFKIPQVGGVIIGDDVEVGACSTIDRATTGNTVIGNGTKLDNHVQVAHNVTIGERTVLVAQVGIGGSSKIGNSVMLGGQAGVPDHISIADGTIMAARSAPMSDLKRGVYAGAPAVPRREWMRSVSHFNRLHELHAKLGELEERLRALEGQGGRDDEH